MWTHFQLREFDSPDEPGSGARMDHEFLDMLDAARSIANCPFKINSGYRSAKHNKKIGGVPNSSHLRGKAADISCTSSEKRFRILAALLAVGFTRVGIHRSFIHVDNDTIVKTPGVAWLYA